MMSERPDPVDELRRLDPIDGRRLAAAWDDSDAKATLLQEIIGTPVGNASPTPIQPTRSRRPRQAVAIAATIAVAAVGLAIIPGLLADTSPAAFAVRELPNGVLEIDTTRGSVDVRDGRALAAELRQHGIDVHVTTITASPSMVGNVDVFGPDWDLHGGMPPGLRYGADGTPEVFQFTIDPAVFQDTITIEISVEADDGEPYTLANEAFEPGEALDGLHCAMGQPLRAADLAPRLANIGITAMWEVISPTDDPGSTHSEPVGGVPDGEVVNGRPVDATTIEFTVIEDGVALDDFWPHVFADGEPCTAERAAAWR